MAATKKQLVEIKLQHAKTTKGTEAYATKNEGALITSLYIRKGAFDGVAVPDEITVTVTV